MSDEVRQTAESGGQKGVKLHRFDLIPFDVLPNVWSPNEYSYFQEGTARLQGFWARHLDSPSLVRVGEICIDVLGPRWSLYLSEVYGRGAAKYEDDNWRRGYPWGWSYGALMRHWYAYWLNGEWLDPECGTPHLAHVLWHCLTLIYFVKNHPKYDDRPLNG